MGDVIHLKISKMKWNVRDLAFLYPPDVFTGAFDNDVLEKKHREEMQKKVDNIKSSMAAEDDPFVAMQILHKKDHLRFLRNNIDAFRQAKKLEKAVITLYTQLNTPFSSDGDANMWNELFEACDNKLLYDHGEPITFSSATIYRGSISGFQRSLIWTPDKITMERIAKRWEDPNLGGGHLFEVDVKKEDVLLFLKLKRGDEVIVSPRFIKTAKIRKYKG